jgi:hypothetical protein
MKLNASFEYRHPRPWIGVRVVSGIWLVILTGIMCKYGYWWGLALLAPAVLLFLSVYHLTHTVQSTARPIAELPCGPQSRSRPHA